MQSSSINKFKYILVLFGLLVLTTSIPKAEGASSPILDNGQSGTSGIGTWKVSSGTNPYGNNSLYSSRVGDRYTFNVELDEPGEYQLFAWWTEYSNRRSSVPYDIKHLGGTDTVTVSQRQGGGQWNQLGTTWNFGTTATITLRSLGDGTTSADAIMLVPVASGSNAAPVLASIGSQRVDIWKTLEFSISATDSDGTTPVLSARGLPPNATFIDYNDGTGTFTWPTTHSDSGTYRITFTATDAIDSSLIDRERVTVSVVDSAGSGSGSGAGPAILDNGQSGTSGSGTWKVSGGSNPYGSNSLYSSRSGDRYIFNVELDAPGEYQLFAWWTEYSNRRSSVPYDIKHLGGTDTVTVNQRQGGGQWNQLGTTWNFGTTATITLRSLGDGTTSADAIMLVPTGGEADPVLIAPPDDVAAPTIDPNSPDIVFYHDFNDEALHTYTADDLRTTWNKSRTGGLKTDAVTIVPDPHPSGFHGNVMRVFYAANSYGGENNSGSQWRMNISGHDELYLAYDVFFEDDAEFVRGGKLPGLQSTDVYSDPGVPADGTDRWTGTLMWRTDGQIVNYMYHANQSRNYGDNVEWDDGPGGQVYFQRGKWHRLEIRYKMNTPGVLDGRVQAWLDGELALDTNEIMYRMPGGEHLDIGTFTFITFYGGGNATWAPSTDQHIYFDNFVISRQPITH